MPAWRVEGKGGWWAGSKSCGVGFAGAQDPLVVFASVQSGGRIFYASFNALNEKHQWKNRTLHLFALAA